MQLNSLTAISPIDGRYFQSTSSLSPYFSEYALIRYRVRTEVEYFIALCEWPLPELKAFPKDKFSMLRDWYIQFDESAAEKIKATEKITNHDVKAVEYFIKTKLEAIGLNDEKEWVHFGLTSQDINNTSVPLLWKHAVECEYLPAILNLNRELGILAEQWMDIPMLARTHGQPASPTRLSGQRNRRQRDECKPPAGYG